MKIVLIPGHEPDKPGAYNKNSALSEYRLNDQIVHEVAARLNEATDRIGIEILFRQPDGYNSAYIRRINATGADAAVEFHHNAYNQQATGTEMLYAVGSVEGQRLAQCFQDEIVNVLGLPNRGIKSRTTDDRGGFFLHNTVMPAVILEPFFIDNDNDLETARQKKDAYLNAHVSAIVKYAENPF